ncbi:MAG: MATE family efflux transporter [Clostridia bacterium]|nr:MATE family efflux transporter [Clostridia bacterium]
MASKHSTDLTKGSVFKKLLAFAFPLWLATLVQQVYHAADVIVVGNFAENSTTALAAVGSTGSVTSVILNLFLGLSAGASVVCANLYGARDYRKLRKAMTTALISSAAGGVIVCVLGVILARPLLLLMGSPHDVIDQATIYMQIIFLGKPAVLVYNTCSAIMRAHGESKRPMYILSVTGLANVVLNLVLVINFHLDVAGVAIATIVSQWLSAIVALCLLFHPVGEYRLKFSEFVFDKEQLLKILRIGVPAGLNAMVFNISNVVVISAVNSMGSVTVAAVSAATSVATLAYTLPSAFTTACISFSGQNYGARRFDRIDKCLWNGILIVEVLFFIVNVFFTLFPEFFLRLYTENNEVIRTAVPKLLITAWGYMIYTVSEIANGCQRGFGKSMGPTLLNIVCICGVRVAWVLFVFPHLEQNLISLYVVFPISWFCSAIAQVISYYKARNKKMLLALREKQTAANT